jgi:hypothetical protein
MLLTFEELRASKRARLEIMFNFRDGYNKPM